MEDKPINLIGCDTIVNSPSEVLIINFKLSSLIKTNYLIKKNINYWNFQVDIQDPFSGLWYSFSQIPVQSLSPEPQLPEFPFGELGGEFVIRVYSVNLASRGSVAEQQTSLLGQKI
jgi:hypothetical protein